MTKITIRTCHACSRGTNYTTRLHEPCGAQGGNNG